MDIPKLSGNLRPTGTVSKEERISILAQWDTARDEYRRECAAITRIRQSLPPRDMRTAEQIVMWEIASQRYKLACRKFKRDRELMIVQLYQDARAEQVDDIVQQLKSAIQAIPTVSIPTAEELKKDARVRDSLLESGQFDAIKAAAQKRMESVVETDQTEDFETPQADCTCGNPAVGLPCICSFQQELSKAS